MSNLFFQGMLWCDMVKTWWDISCCIRWSCFVEVIGNWQNPYGCLYCIRCKRPIIALLYRYAIAIVARVIVGEMTMWRHIDIDQDDEDHGVEPVTRWSWSPEDEDQWSYMILAISCHIFWLHMMFICYTSYSVLFDGSIIRWSLTNYQEVFSLSMHRCESSSCWDTTWWSGVIGSTFKYNGCKTVAHAEYSGYTWRA